MRIEQCILVNLIVSSTESEQCTIVNSSNNSSEVEHEILVNFCNESEQGRAMNSILMNLKNEF